MIFFLQWKTKGMFNLKAAFFLHKTKVDRDNVLLRSRKEQKSNTKVGHEIHNGNPPKREHNKKFQHNRTLNAKFHVKTHKVTLNCNIYSQSLSKDSGKTFFPSL